MKYPIGIQDFRKLREGVPYADSPKEKIAVDVNFSAKEKQVQDWAVEEY